ncbi:MAG: hypothetical protein D6744_18735 [Planctomycetota bacterium]|nr:MAG: hypothetical protein D6744_18735 [Planctomycetota bacterium]
MPVVTPPPDHPNIRIPQVPPIPPRFLALGLIPLLVLLGVCYWWFVQRIEVQAGEVLVLVRKWGEPLPAEAGDQVVLYPELLKQLGEPPDSTRYTGILYEVLPEGRYFYDPLFWKRITAPAQFVGENEIGILIRKFGRPLPPGKALATEPDERGPVREWLQPGRHNINPFAYDVVRVPKVQVPEGSIGVQTLLSGAEPKNPNSYVVASGERGVQPDILPPGLYEVNPYEKRIDVIDVRSHTIDLRGDDAIRFPSNDSFEILIEGTVEYAVRQDKAPYVWVAIGDHEDVESKIILPYIRSLSRIEGSKLIAREFISGESRKQFQDRIFEGLRESCYTQGIEIRAVLVRKIEPPAAIAGPISERQIAQQEIARYENEIKVARSEAKLVEQEELQKQNQAIGGANREVVTLTLQAEQSKAVAITEATQRLEVAKLELEAAQETAVALRSRGQAEAQVTRLEYEAQAQPLAQAIAAFGGGDAYAQFFFYQKLAPALHTITDSTSGPLADIFRAMTDVPDRPPSTALPALSARSRADEPDSAGDVVEGGEQ